MTTYGKSLIALGIAAAAVIFSGLWLRTRAVTLSELTVAIEGMKVQAAEMPAHEAMVIQFEQKLEELRSGIKPITDRFGGRDYGTPELVMAVVKAAGMSGMEMVNAYKLERQDDAFARQWSEHGVSVVSHRIVLRGPYEGLVKFLRSMDEREMSVKMTALEVLPSSRAASTATDRSRDERALDEVDVIMQLSVFLLDE